jgi:hypothetical protein
MIGLLREDEFYATAPAFAFLKGAAKGAWATYQAKKDCARCGREWQYMQGCVDALFLKMRQLKEAKDPALEDVRTFIESRKGYACRPIVIYYRRSKKQGKIAKFQF